MSTQVEKPIRFYLYENKTPTNSYIHMSKKYLSTPPFVTTKHDLEEEKPSNLEINVASSVACSADGQIVYMTDSNGLWKSEDGGQTWLALIEKS